MRRSREFELFSGRTIRLLGLEPAQEPLEPPASVPRQGTAAALPSITCIARFMSDVLPNDHENIASVLCVIWFQGDFAFPVDPLVLMELASMDWDAHAVGWLP